MSKVDDVFDFADELIDEWGHYVTFVRKENSIYDPETGSTTESETRQQVKVVISKLDISEYGGLYQQKRRQDHPRPRPSQLHLHHRPGLFPRSTRECT